MKAELYVIQGVGYLNVEIDNFSENVLYLLKLMSKHTLIRYYWRSKQDPTYLELFEPKIYDAFTFVADCSGSPQDMRDLLDEYSKNHETMKTLSKMYQKSLTRDEIMSYASQFLASLNKEDVNIL